MPADVNFTTKTNNSTTSFGHSIACKHNGHALSRIRIWHPVLFYPWIRDSDPGWKKSGSRFRHPGSGINIPDHIFESLVNFFLLKVLEFFLNSVIRNRIRDRKTKVQDPTTWGSAFSVLIQTILRRESSVGPHTQVGSTGTVPYAYLVWAGVQRPATGQPVPARSHGPAHNTFRCNIISVKPLQFHFHMPSWWSGICRWKITVCLNGYPRLI